MGGMRTMASTSTLSRSELAALQAIRARGQATRGEVAAALGLGQPMTARVVGRLQALGLVRETGRTALTGPGRQPLLLEIHPGAASVAAIDIGTEVIHILVADLHGTPRTYREAPSALLAEKSHEEIVALLADLVRAVIREAGPASERVGAVGVAVTGIIDSDKGLCLARSNTPGWDNFPLADQLSQALDLPVVLEETARAKSLAELRLGAARGLSHYLYVEAGLAIGASIVINGQPFRGVSGLAGELGHVTVDPGGELCRCGNRGCVQASASALALVRHARDVLGRGVFSSLARVGDGLTLADVSAAAAEGDKLALSLLTDAGERLGEAIGMALNLLGLDVVVMGGRLAHCSPVVLEAARRLMRLRVLPIVPRERILVCSALGSDAAARGVALQASDWLLDAPVERLLTLAGDERDIQTPRDEAHVAR